MSSSSSICTVVRVRPLSSSETERGCKVILSTNGSTTNLTVTDPAFFDGKPTNGHVGTNEKRMGEKSFGFDHILWSVVDNNRNRASQQDVYDHCGTSAVQHCLDGYNCSIFAYGQTGSGKVSYPFFGCRFLPPVRLVNMSFLTYCMCLAGLPVT